MESHTNSDGAEPRHPCPDSTPIYAEKNLPYESISDQSMMNLIYATMLSGGDVSEAIYRVLRIVGQHFHLSHVYIAEFRSGEPRCTFRWVDVDVPDALRHAYRTHLEASQESDWTHLFCEEQRQWDGVSPLEPALQDYVDSSRFRCFLTTPLIVGGRSAGVLVFADTRAPREWPGRQTAVLSGISHLISVTLTQRRAEKQLSRSERMLHTVLDNAGVYVLVLDAHTREILFTNERLLSLAPHLRVSRTYSQRFLSSQESAPVVFAQDQERTFELYCDKLSHPIWVRVDETTVRWLDGRDAFLYCAVDITDAKARETIQLASHETMDRVFSSMNTIIFAIDAHTFKIVFANHLSLARMGADLVGKICYQGVHRRNTVCEDCPFNHPFDLGYTATYEIHNTDTELWLSATGTSTLWQDGREVVVISAIDISEIKRKESEILQLAYKDQLLGIPNRRQMEDDLQRLLMKPGSQGALLVLDLDDFKNVNDIYGHRVGDSLLSRISAMLSACVPEGRCYRSGGDEFALLYEPCSETEAARAATEIVSIFQRPFYLEGECLFSTVSVGVALYPRDGRSPIELLRSADVALHEAKSEGKNRFSFFSKEKDAHFMASVALEHRLRQAIQTFGDFRVFYQPQIDMLTGQCVGAEALVRWFDPAHGLIMPDQFIPLAERTGMIVPLDEWVLHTACVQAKKWHDAGWEDFHISVNLSRHQIYSASAMNSVCNAVLDTGIDPACLTIEITESLEIHDIDSYVALLENLRSLGLSIAMDDFGTGYSSLGNLRYLPLDTIKIDRSFIRGYREDKFSVSFIKSIIELAHSLNMTVCVEGLEEKVQCEMIRELKSDYGQGYFYSRPIGAAEFEARYAPFRQRNADPSVISQGSVASL